MNEISPGVRKLVAWLNKKGFHTTDSGDGSNFKAGMECAVEFPMVAMVSTPVALISDANYLVALLKTVGVNLRKIGPLQYGNEDTDVIPCVQATCDPVDMTAIIMLTNVTDEDLEL